MPSREINVRRFCANIVDPDQTHARYEFCFFFHHFYAPEGTSGGILKSHRPSVCLSVRQSVRPLQIVSQRYLINY